MSLSPGLHKPAVIAALSKKNALRGVTLKVTSAYPTFAKKHIGIRDTMQNLYCRLQTYMNRGEKYGIGNARPRALSCIRRNLLSTLTHVSLLVCNWRRAFFSLHRHAPVNKGMILRPMGRFGERRRRVPAQTFPGAILQFQKTIAP